MKIGIGKILGLVGGILAIVGVVLPWATASGTVMGMTISMSASGLDAAKSGGEWVAYVYGTAIFGVLGLIFVLISKKSTTMLAFVFGLLALILSGVALVRITQLIGGLSAPGVSVGAGIGLYICVVGGLLLLIGCLLAFKAVGAQAQVAAPLMAAPPPPA